MPTRSWRAPCRSPVVLPCTTKLSTCLLYTSCSSPFVKAGKRPSFPMHRVRRRNSRPVTEKFSEVGSASGSISRVLSLDDHLSEASVARRLKHATRTYGGPPCRVPICACSGWGFPSRAVADALVRSYRTVSAFLPLWRAEARGHGGVFFSVALSVGSPRPAVSWHPALWSPDFPHTEVRDRLARSRMVF